MGELYRDWHCEFCGHPHDVYLEQPRPRDRASYTVMCPVNGHVGRFVANGERAEVDRKPPGAVGAHPLTGNH